MRRLRAALLFSAWLLAVGLPSARAEVTPPYAATINGWELTLAVAKDALDAPVSSPEDRYTAAGDKLQQVLVEARELQARLDQRGRPLQQQLDSLGPAPAKDAPLELEDIAAQRNALILELAQIGGQQRQIALIRVRAIELIEQVGRQQQRQLIDRLGERGPVPVRPAVWLQAGADLTRVLGEVVTSPFVSAWVNVEAETPHSLFYVGAVVAALLLGWPLRRWLLRRFGPDPAVEQPTYARRVLAAAITGFANTLIPALAIGIFVLTLLAQNWLVGSFGRVVQSVARNIIIFVLIAGTARSALSPMLPAWRIVRIPPESAIKVSRRITVIAAVVAIHRTIADIAGEQLGPSPELDSVLIFLRTTIIGALLLSILPRRHWVGEERPVEAPFMAFLRLAGGGLALASPLLALAGFSTLALYLDARLLFTIFFVGVAIMLRLALRELLEQVLSPQRQLFLRLGAPMGFTERTRALTLMWLKLLLDPVIFLPLALMLLAFYGVATTNIRLWLSYLTGEFRIGGVTISPIDIVLAFLVLVFGIGASGSLRRWLATKVLPRTRLDFGARNSIAAGAGYLAIGVAVMVAIATAGVDLSSLAFVAGALSVGIGFGLRTVVENFVAGLLILVERPVKIGDWIVVGNSEGTVKRISVRSTEIETFDRASVILPNSEMIASAVTNWTYQNRTARIIIKLGVAYGSPTRQVRDLLLKCAKDHPDVLAFPEPQVLFQGFGEWTLNFELRCFVGDTDKLGIVRSDLCFAIDDAFRAGGIDMSVPRVLYMRADGATGAGDGRAIDSVLTSEPPQRPAASQPVPRKDRP